MMPFLKGPMELCRQELNQAFILNGCLYFDEWNYLNKIENYISEETIAYEMPVERSLDIDSMIDWQYAQYLASNKKVHKENTNEKWVPKR